MRTVYVILFPNLLRSFDTAKRLLHIACCDMLFNSLAYSSDHLYVSHMNVIKSDYFYECEKGHFKK